ncbi:MAG: class I SAM-dependent methyltransferase [Acidimicrobiales bacterium]|jgi:SAM-dependent methyltransferase
MSESTEQTADAPSWDELAPWWRDTFTHGADLEYEHQILPLAVAHLAGRRRVLDLGTGEGQLARRLAAAPGPPALVVGLDASAAQLGNARAEGGGPHWVQAVGEQLPFASGCFDAVVCCLVIEHASDGDAMLAEAARVVAKHGRFLLLINHPIVQGPGSGLVDDAVLGERYWRIGPYLPETRNLEQVDSGVHVAFAHRPLSRYINPLAELGLFLVRLEEPEPPFEFLCGSVDMDFERAMPRLCVMIFERR